MRCDSYSLIHEPRGSAYTRLVDWLALRATSFLFVVREGVSLNESGQARLEAFRYFGACRESVTRWPGTELVDEVADVWAGRLEPETVELLKSSVGGLYEWEPPNLPEDLCFRRADGSALLVSTTHERDSYFCLSEAEAGELRSGLVGLDLLKDTENACQ
jgi:hypothetical protein